MQNHYSERKEMFEQVEIELKIAKEETLSKVVAEFYQAISKHGYTLPELLLAVSELVDAQYSYEACLLVEKATNYVKGENK